MILMNYGVLVIHYIFIFLYNTSTFINLVIKNSNFGSDNIDYSLYMTSSLGAINSQFITNGVSKLVKLIIIDESNDYCGELPQ